MQNRFTRAGKGQALLEFALVLPILILFIIGLFDVGYAVFLQNMLANAAREGARTGVILLNTDTAITNRVNAVAPGLNPQVTIIPSPNRSFNNPITVTVTYTYVPLTPVLGRITGALHLSSTSSMIVEGMN